MIGYNRTNRNIRDRIIFLGSEIDSDFANLILAQLLFLEAEDPAKDIYMYISCSGGSVSEGMVIFDTMKLIKPDVYTVCMGTAIGMGAFLLSAGTKGKRMCLPSSRIKICKPEARQGQLTDTERKQFIYANCLLNDLLAEHTGHSPEKIDKDTDRDLYMSATEAKEYGIIDTIGTLAPGKNS